MGLNENQFRGVGVTLRLLEERLARIERIVEEDEEGILYRRQAHFTREQRARMHQLVAAMRDQIRAATEQFHFTTEEQDTAREIIGTLALSSESLEECRPRKLGAYGRVDPTLEETLDPIVRRLIHLLFDLQSAAKGMDS